MQDYGVKQAPKRKDISEMKSSLAPQLLQLMKMLFNVETYRCILVSQMSCLPTFFCSFSCVKINLFSRAAMMEFEINMSEMPLGKLSKENIQKGLLISFLVDLFFLSFKSMMI
jgi:poly [ADP-ribose] polymerase 1